MRKNNRALFFQFLAIVLFGTMLVAVFANATKAREQGEIAVAGEKEDAEAAVTYLKNNGYLDRMRTYIPSNLWDMLDGSAPLTYSLVTEVVPGTGAQTQYYTVTGIDIPRLLLKRAGHLVSYTDTDNNNAIKNKILTDALQAAIFKLSNYCNDNPIPNKTIVQDNLRIFAQYAINDFSIFYNSFNFPAFDGEYVTIVIEPTYNMIADLTVSALFAEQPNYVPVKRIGRDAFSAELDFAGLLGNGGHGYEYTLNNIALADVDGSRATNLKHIEDDAFRDNIRMRYLDLSGIVYNADSEENKVDISIGKNIVANCDLLEIVDISNIDLTAVQIYRSNGVDGVIQDNAFGNPILQSFSLECIVLKDSASYVIAEQGTTYLKKYAAVRGNAILGIAAVNLLTYPITTRFYSDKLPAQIVEAHLYNKPFNAHKTESVNNLTAYYPVSTDRLTRWSLDPLTYAMPSPGYYVVDGMTVAYEWKRTIDNNIEQPALGARIVPTTVAENNIIYKVQWMPHIRPYNVIIDGAVSEMRRVTINGFNDEYLDRVPDKNNIEIAIPATWRIDGTSEDAKVVAVNSYAFYDSALAQLLDDGLSIIREGNVALVTNLIDQYYRPEYRITKINFQYAANLQQIGQYAFASTNIRELSFAGATALETIGTNAFYASTELRSIDFSAAEKLRWIRDSAFAFCVNLESLEFQHIPSLETIGYRAFYNCWSLKLIDFRTEDSDGDGRYVDFGNEALNGVSTDDLSILVSSFAAYQYYTTPGNTLYEYRDRVAYEMHVMFALSYDAITKNPIEVVSQEKLWSFPLYYEKVDDKWVNNQNGIFDTNGNTTREPYVLPNLMTLDPVRYSGIVNGRDYYWRFVDGINENVLTESSIVSGYTALIKWPPEKIFTFDGAYRITGFDASYLEGLVAAGTEDFVITIPSEFYDGRTFVGRELLEITNGAFDPVTSQYQFFPHISFSGVDFTEAKKLIRIGDNAFANNNLGVVDITPLAGDTEYGTTVFGQPNCIDALIVGRNPNDFSYSSPAKDYKEVETASKAIYNQYTRDGVTSPFYPYYNADKLTYVVKTSYYYDNGISTITRYFPETGEYLDLTDVRKLYNLPMSWTLTAKENSDGIITYKWVNNPSFEFEYPYEIYNPPSVDYREDNPFYEKQHTAGPALNIGENNKPKRVTRTTKVLPTTAASYEDLYDYYEYMYQETLPGLIEIRASFTGTEAFLDYSISDFEYGIGGNPAYPILQVSARYNEVDEDGAEFWRPRVNASTIANKKFTVSFESGSLVLKRGENNMATLTISVVDDDLHVETCYVQVPISRRVFDLSALDEAISKNLVIDPSGNIIDSAAMAIYLPQGLTYSARKENISTSQTSYYTLSFEFYALDNAAATADNKYVRGNPLLPFSEVYSRPLARTISGIITVQNDHSNDPQWLYTIDNQWVYIQETVYNGMRYNNDYVFLDGKWHYDPQKLDDGVGGKWLDEPKNIAILVASIVGGVGLLTTLVLFIVAGAKKKKGDGKNTISTVNIDDKPQKARSSKDPYKEADKASK
ncbi:MAG: leucine-rich repeat domain-containing protein [Christensenellaceae bacterium]|nr:leucine-rich repeat domain-containing protein [Christensenellaceae bacterium]